MKKIILAVIVVATLCFGGCKNTDIVSDGPVAPQYQSNEMSRSGDPKLPYMTPWWKFNQQ